MIDIQKQIDLRQIPLEQVGIKGLQYPITVLDKINKIQHTSAIVDLTVNLPQHYKGTHMSRFVEIFHKYHKNLTMKHFLLMLNDIKQSLDAKKSFGTITFPFFLSKTAPVSCQKSIMSYTCTYEGEVSTTQSFFVSILVPVTTLCPCSKAISKEGAHNQRSLVTVKLQSKGFFWIEDIIKLVEDCASSPVYSLLKRPDEKFVTEYAYNHPRFVEDIVREVYIALKNTDLFKWYSIKAQNFESIHNHDAYAYTTSDTQSI